MDVLARRAERSSTTEPWVVHFLKFLPLLAVSYFTAGGLLIGLVFVLRRTGYRARDLLLMLIPFVNAAILINVIWRFTAKRVYWQPRFDLPSGTMFDRVNRPDMPIQESSVVRGPISYGAPGEDDRAINPQLLHRISHDCSFVLVEHDEESLEPDQSPHDRDVVRGDRILWLTEGPSRVPIAVVSPDHAGDLSVLQDVAQQWWAPFRARSRKLPLSRWIPKTRTVRIVVVVIGLVTVLGVADVWAYFGETRALSNYLQTSGVLTVPGVDPGTASDPASLSRALAQLQSAQEASRAAAVELDAVEAVFVVPILPWHRTHRLAKAVLAEAGTLEVRFHQTLTESWRLGSEAYRNPQRGCVRTAFSFFTYENYCAEYGLFPDAALYQAALEKVQEAKAIDVRRQVLVQRFEELMHLTSSSGTNNTQT